MELHHADLQQAAEGIDQSPENSISPTIEAMVEEPVVMATGNVSAKKQADFIAVHQLHQQGKSIRHIARHLPITCDTVWRYLPHNHKQYPSTQPRLRPTRILDHEPYLRKRWQGGEQRGSQLYDGIRRQGYRSSIQTLYRLLQGFPKSATTPITEHPPASRFSIRKVAWLLSQPGKR